MTKNDNKNLIIGVLVIVLVLVLLGSFGFGGGMMRGYNPGFMILGWIFNIIIIILIILGIFWLIKHVDFNGIKIKK